MKVFNITDAATAALRNQGLEKQHIKVGETVIPPGGSANLRGTSKERAELQVFIKVGAVALDELPAAYAAKRGLNLDGSPIPAPAPAPEKAVKVLAPMQDVWAEPAPVAEELPKRRGK